MNHTHVLFLRKITETLFCSSDLNPSQQSSSSGDLRPEMIESETPPLVAPSYEAGDPEVSSQRVFQVWTLEKVVRLVWHPLARRRRG